MKTSTRLATLVLLASAACRARAEVQLQFSRRAGRHPSSRLWARDSASEPLWGGGYVYAVNVSIGTPGQDLALLVSPSTGVTWVPDLSFCDYIWNGYGSDDDDGSPGSAGDDPNYNCPWGYFNVSASSTYLSANQEHMSFQDSLPDGSSVSGDNGTDTFRLGDLEFDHFPVGTVDTANQWIGVLGLGPNSSYYAATESSTLPDRLVQAGRAATKAYSLWLDDPAGASGGLLFGAVDTSRYQGDLVALDADTTFAYPGTFGVRVAGANGSRTPDDAASSLAWNEFPFDATVDPSFLISYLPQNLAQQMWDLAGAVYNDTMNAAVIACDAPAAAAAPGADGPNPRFSFALGGADGPVLDVQYADLIVPAETQTARAMGYYLRRAPGLCVFGVQNSSMEGYYLLGGGLLRRSYLVFDLVNQEVAVAAAKFASSSSATPTIVEFASYGALVPSSTPYCSSSRSSSSSGSAARCRGSSTGSGSSSGGGDGTTSSGGHTVISKYASMRNRDIAIGLGVSIGAIALAGLVAAMVVWKRVCFGGRHDGDDDVGKGKASALPEVETVPASVPLLAPPAPPAATAATTGAGDGDASSAAGSLSGRDRALSTVPEAGETHPSDAPPTVPRIPHVEDIHMRDSHSPDAQDQEDTNAGSSATGNQVSSASAASEGAELQRPDRGEELHTGRGEAEVDTSSGVDGHGERRDADVGTPLRL